MNTNGAKSIIYVRSIGQVDRMEFDEIGQRAKMIVLNLLLFI